MKTTQTRNILFLAGILAMVLVFGSVLAGCKTDTDDDPDGGGKTITITGNPTVGQSLIVTANGFMIQRAGAAWYRSDDATADITGDTIIADSGDTYQPVAGDKGKYIYAYSRETGTTEPYYYSNIVGPITE